MPDIFELLNSDLGKQLITKTGNEAGISSEQTSEVLSMALPALMGAMQQNATSAQGAQSLLGALTSKHDGSILDNLGDFFQGGVNSDVLQDGSGILGHILGGKQTAIENGISKKTGISSQQIAQILKIAAPILMGYLGKQAKEKNVSTTDGLGGLLEGLGGGSKGGSLLTSLLDADGDGSIIDDVAGMVLGGNNKKSTAGSLLGSLFKKK